jgi:hypothetical protein
MNTFLSKKENKPPFRGLEAKPSSQAFWLNKKLGNRVSPPFEGGVVGMIDYQKYTDFYPRPGWLIH